ncbi:MAG TPA: hypothetical protein PKL99_02150 [Syntrophales bacterium]|nr:hypothetical protein [Syntrophales bacterium]
MTVRLLVPQSLGGWRLLGGMSLDPLVIWQTVKGLRTRVGRVEKEAWTS